MSKVSFFTPIHYSDQPKSISETILEKVDHYFYLGGKRAMVIQDQANNGKKLVNLSEAQISLIAKIVRLVSYLSILLPFILLITKAVLRSIHSYHICYTKTKLESVQNIPMDALKKIESHTVKKIEAVQNIELKMEKVISKKPEVINEPTAPVNAQEALEQGIEINQEMIKKIEDLLPNILAKDEENLQIEWLDKNEILFRLSQFPHLEFYIDNRVIKDISKGSKYVCQLFENMVKAKDICISNHLNLLVVPHAKKFSVQSNGKEYILIAREHFDLNADPEELYRQFSNHLNETVRQMAIFIAQSGLNSFDWVTTPLINPEKPGDKQFLLLNLHKMDCASEGFIGSSDCHGDGLIKCVSEEQVDIVMKEANKLNIPLQNNERTGNIAKEERLKELKQEVIIRQYHKDKGIVTRREPIIVDINTLELDLTEEHPIREDEEVDLNFLEDSQSNDHQDQQYNERTMTLKQAVEDVIKFINFQIHTQPLSLNRRIDSSSSYPSYYDYMGTNNKIWIVNILNALQKNHIHSWIFHKDEYCYYIQA